MKVRVGIPHFYFEKPGGTGYGSGKPGERVIRGLALGRCLAALLALERTAGDDLVLNIGKRVLNRTGPLQRGNRALSGITLEIHLFTTGENLLQEVVEQFTDRVLLHRVCLDDPRQLPLAARDFLIHEDAPADLTLYLEDDLVIGDPLFLDKQAWFLAGCQHRAVLMPHRYERVPGHPGQRLLVDGPLRDGFIRRFTTPKPEDGRGRFWDGQEVVFDRTDNPHSGLFCLSNIQVEDLRKKTLPCEGFLGPMETAATLTALSFFPVMKPALVQRQFLWVEHGHPSFQSYARRWHFEANTHQPAPHEKQSFDNL
jgi:hypothetical protein